ncbi:unnamed protein product [Urochloa decumbens]|uniref:Disease resistance protein At4g27190-like leucine-rich repeats domain-containing protein n=1 Tax=Urochloa decumbens TaxID=240449 RepID=A0ABC9BP80_9POAL
MAAADEKIGISATDVKTAVQEIVPYLLEGLTIDGSKPKDIYFYGWFGLGASTVLRAIAEHPPPSLLERFNKIIHIDCSRWKSRRELQRAIAYELKLTQQVAADFDRQDEEDDFSGIDQGSRAEIGTIARVIFMSLVSYRCLVIFHNGSDGMVDLLSCGIPQLELVGTKVLWTSSSSGKISQEKLRPGLFLYGNSGANVNAALVEEARETVLYTRKLGLGVTLEIATYCWLYYFSLSRQGAGDIIYFDWATHASSYWVCDGIVGCGKSNDQAWELANALQKHMRVEECTHVTLFYYIFKQNISTKHWVCRTLSYFREVPSGTTSLFFSPPHGSGYVSFPSKRFHEADQLRVLKLCRCTFSFSSPPFHCCHNLRFLGLDQCMDEQEQQLGAEEDQTGARAMETFQRLWVLDVSHTDWELEFPIETEEAMVATDIREVHVNKGRIWRKNLAWRQLPNLCKLRVVDPTSSWVTGGQDEFMDMVKIELLDLSKNITIQVLPNLSGATNLKTLVLDGCVGLEHVGPQGLPPSLESFCLDSGLGEDDENKAKISSIRLAGCARLADFRLHGSLPNLEELDLSHTSVKMLDLKDKAAVKSLRKVFLVGCEQLRSISWPYTERHPVRLLCIDTRATGEVSRKPSSCDSSMVYQGKEEKEYCHAFVAITDTRFLRSIVFLFYRDKGNPKVKGNLYWSSSTSKDDGRSRRHSKKKLDGQVAAGSPLPRSLTYHDVSTEHQIITTQIDGCRSSATTAPFQQPLDFHMEIGEGVSVIPNAVSKEGSHAIYFTLWDSVHSLHVHDTSSITSVTPEHLFQSPGADGKDGWGVMYRLKWCRVERCPKLQTVFTIKDDELNFCKLETFWAAHLLMAQYVWHSIRPKTETWRSGWCYPSFDSLRAIHLHFCPRLVYVLRLSGNNKLTQLETLHILCCGNLRQVFAVEQEQIPPYHEKSWQFPELKSLFLHDLSSLQLICEVKMFAPDLETVYVRGCWGLRRLPATDGSRLEDGRPVAVDCEDWWDNLEWDGMESGHHPSLFEPRHSKYYKKRHLRSTVLR